MNKSLSIGLDGKCSTNAKCPVRYFGARYQYVGGYYGGCSEEAMMLSIVRDGPIAVAFKVNCTFHLHTQIIDTHKETSDMHIFHNHTRLR